jgi:hypothetical protein
VNRAIVAAVVTRRARGGGLALPGEPGRPRYRGFLGCRVRGAATAARSRRSVASSVNLSSTVPAACCSRPVLPNIGEDAGSRRGVIHTASWRLTAVNPSSTVPQYVPGSVQRHAVYRLEHTLSRPATVRVATVDILARCDVRPGQNPQDTFLGATDPRLGRHPDPALSKGLEGLASKASSGCAPEREFPPQT